MNREALTDKAVVIGGPKDRIGQTVQSALIMKETSFPLQGLRAESELSLGSYETMTGNRG